MEVRRRECSCVISEQAEAAVSLRMEQEVEKQHVPRPWENVMDTGTEPRLAMLSRGSAGQGVCGSQEDFCTKIYDTQTSTQGPLHFLRKLLLCLPKS